VRCGFLSGWAWVAELFVNRKLLLLTCAPTTLQPKVESWIAVMPIATVSLGSVERRFSAPALSVEVVI
jgi:hypothetical protein